MTFDFCRGDFQGSGHDNSSREGIEEERGVEDASRRVARVKLELANDDGIEYYDFD